jgi:hypothetical protein
MKKTIILIAFATLTGLASFAQDRSRTKMKTPIHKNQIHSITTTDSTSGSMNTMLMDSNH